MPDVWPGEAFPLGATWDGVGTNFSVFSSVAERVEVCLFSTGPDGTVAESRVPLTEVDGFCWHGFVSGVAPGTRYGFRVDGPHDPERGLRCNPHKLLLDPYAKAVDGEVRWHPDVMPYDVGGGDDRVRNDADSAAYVPKSIVVDSRFDWQDDGPPGTPWHQTIIYETHVKGLTARHPAVPPELRGTYAGLAHPDVVDYLMRLGVTAVELLPVHQFVHDRRLALLDPPLRNYWGYNSLCFLAPHNGYASRPGEAVVNEFKSMVKALHAAGLEVILDVVFNHTGEGDELGPTLCFRGLDNARYYRLQVDNPRFYWNVTGTGNTFNARDPQALQLIMDSLRYWVQDMHVDGFRFDLAVSLARQFELFDPMAPFLDLVQQDPVLRQVKLIAEPWDVWGGGYQVGNFPPRWSEWNGRYRDSVRDYWREDRADLPEVARRLTGSPDLYRAGTRRPRASVNFVTAHDGFTLADLVSYNEKRNAANREGNRDGTDDNRSWNCGAEGPTDDPDILELRARQCRNLLATLLLSQGIPMLLGGDERGRTQQGNNNAYCQDNEISWYDWLAGDEELREFTAALIAFRRGHRVLTRRRFFDDPENGEVVGPGGRQFAWFKPDGAEMAEADWNTGYARSAGLFLNGERLGERDREGVAVRGDSLYLLINAWDQPLAFVLPAALRSLDWTLAVDTACRGRLAVPRPVDAATVPLQGRHVVVLTAGTTRPAETAG